MIASVAEPRVAATERIIDTAIVSASSASSSSGKSSQVHIGRDADASMKTSTTTRFDARG